MSSTQILGKHETYVGALASMFFPYGGSATVLAVESIVRYAHGGIKEVHTVYTDTVDGVRVPRTGVHAGRNVFRMNRDGDLKLVDDDGRLGRKWYTPELRLNSTYEAPYMD